MSDEEVVEVEVSAEAPVTQVPDIITPENKPLVLSDYNSAVAAVLTPELEKKYTALLALADKSPVVGVREMKQWDANQDFIVFYDNKGNGHFDIQRSFALKAMRVFNFGKRNIQTHTTELKSGEVLVDKDVEVFSFEDPAVYTTVSGACSTRETTSGAKSGNTRAYHDAVAIAETRALKRGVEELAGMPIINAMIRDIFGGFEIKARELRNVSPTTTTTTETTEPPDEVKQLLRDISAGLKRAKVLDLLGQVEFDAWKARALNNVGNPGVLSNIKSEIGKIIEGGAR